MLAAVLAATLGTAATASAGRTGYFTNEKPGNACRSASPNVWSWYGALVNSDTAPQRLWCPLDRFSSDIGYQETSSIWANLDRGAGSVSACSVNVLESPSSGWFYSPTTITANGSMDTVSFGSMYSGVGAELECVLPAGSGVLFDYSERTYQYFDWASW